MAEARQRLARPSLRGGVAVEWLDTVFDFLRSDPLISVAVIILLLALVVWLQAYIGRSG